MVLHSIPGCAALWCMCPPRGCCLQVGKRLVLLYVHSEVPLEGELCSSPSCLEHVTAEERIVVRWVPDATRD